MIIKELHRHNLTMYIHTTGNEIFGTKEYSFEVITETGRRINDFHEVFKKYSHSLEFANKHGFK